MITARSGGERCLGGAYYHTWDGIKERFAGFKMDIKVLTRPGRFFYAVFNKVRLSFSTIFSTVIDRHL